MMVFISSESPHEDDNRYSGETRSVAHLDTAKGGGRHTLRLLQEPILQRCGGGCRLTDSSSLDPDARSLNASWVGLQPPESGHLHRNSGRAARARGRRGAETHADANHTNQHAVYCMQHTLVHIYRGRLLGPHTQPVGHMIHLGSRLALVLVRVLQIATRRAQLHGAYLKGEGFGKRSRLTTQKVRSSVRTSAGVTW
jgi:hypothetical protein